MEEQPSQNQQPVYYSAMPEGGKSPKRIKMIIGLLFSLLLVVGVIIFLVAQFNTKTVTKETEYNAKTVVESAAVSITKEGFVPATIRVKVGQSVSWKNTDGSTHQIASDPHPTHTSLSELFSDPLNKDETYSFTFDTSGTFTYHDEMDPIGRQATVVVE